MLIEPFAGVLYGYLKVAVGPRVGLLGLLAVYAIAVPALLAALVSLHADAGTIWATLLAARLLFAASNCASLARRPHSRGTSARMEP